MNRTTAFSIAFHAFLLALVIIASAVVRQVVRTTVNHEALVFVPKLPVPTVRPVYHTSATGGHASPAPLPAVAVTKLAVGSPRIVTQRLQSPAPPAPQVVKLIPVAAPALPVLPAAAGPVVRTVTQAGFGSQTALIGSNRVGMGIVAGGFGSGTSVGQSGHGTGTVRAAGFTQEQAPTVVRAVVVVISHATKPVVLSIPRARFSAAMRQDAVSGTVLVRVLLRADGTSQPLSVVRSLGQDADHAALDVAQHIAFVPARDANGQPVDYAVTLTVDLDIS
jgi:TonB family protein